MVGNWLIGWSTGWSKVVEGWFIVKRKYAQKQRQPAGRPLG